MTLHSKLSTVLLLVLGLGLWNVAANAQPTNYTVQGKTGIPAPSYAVTFLDDFLGFIDIAKASLTASMGGSTSASDSVYNVTVAGTNTFFAIRDSVIDGGAAQVYLDSTGGAGASDICVQLQTHPFRMIAGKELTFEAKLRPGVVGTHYYTIGMSQTSTTANDSIVQGTGFIVKGDSNLYFMTNNGVTQSADTNDTGVDLADSTDVTVRWSWDGRNTIRYWVDGDYIGQSTGTTARPDSVWMAPTLGMKQNSLAGVNHRLWLDYWYVQQER